MRDAILVLGMHRSGTSAIAGVVAKLGAASPRSLMQADERNARGYFESVLFWHFHDRLLESAGSYWHDWRAFDMARVTPALADLEGEARRLLQEEFGEAPLFVLKDPRICRFAPFWLSVFSKAGIAPHVVIPFRSPLEVARSICSREGFSTEKALLLWLRHTLDAERQTRHLPRSCVSMDALIDDWRKCVAQISRDVGIVWPNSGDQVAAEIDQFLSRDLRHHEVANVEQGPAQRWVVRVYEAMLILARNPRSKLALATLDEITESFEQACALFGHEYTNVEAHVKRLQIEAAAVAAERDALLEAPEASTASDSQPQAPHDTNPTDFDALAALNAQTQEVRHKLSRLREQLAVGPVTL